MKDKNHIIIPRDAEKTFDKAQLFHGKNSQQLDIKGTYSSIIEVAYH
jgi:hypothetical protein